MSQLETVSASETETLEEAVTDLQLWFWRGQLPSGHSINESTGLVGAVAEWLVRGVPATAETDRGPPSQAKGFSFGINDLEVAFNADRTVVIDCYFRGNHFFLLDEQ
jgi:hypothetical protein